MVIRYPEVYHMAQMGSWPSIQMHGLLSTSALLDLFEIQGAERFKLESQWRPQSRKITHPVHGSAVIRDQWPIPDNELKKVLIDMETREWYELINRKTFFWANWDGLAMMLGAINYRDKPHSVLAVDTLSLLDRHMQEVTLTDQNSGSVYSKKLRGRDTFRKVSEFSSRWVDELAVDYSVPDVVDLTTRVEVWKANNMLSQIYARASPDAPRKVGV